MSLFLPRILFISLIFFEGLNYIRVLNFTLDFTWLGLLITVLAVFLFLEILNKKLKQHFSVWYLTLSAVLVDAGGDMLHLYSRIPQYDTFAHFYASAVAAAIILIVALRHNKKLTMLKAWLAISSTIVFGVLYEMEEYFEDVIFHTNRWGGGEDTMIDLVANFLGAIISVLVAKIILTKKDLKFLLPGSRDH